MSQALTFQGISSVYQAWKLERLDKYDLKGTGTVIAILDTEITTDFPIKFKERINCRPDLSPIISVNHGTLCAATAASSPYNDPEENIVIPRGVAPEAEVDIYRIADGKDDNSLDCTNDAVLEALTHIHDKIHIRKVDVVSISYELEEDVKVPYISEKITQLTDKGVVFVAAVGNRGRYQSHPIVFQLVLIM